MQLSMTISTNGKCFLQSLHHQVPGGLLARTLLLLSLAAHLFEQTVLSTPLRRLVIMLLQIGHLVFAAAFFTGPFFTWQTMSGCRRRLAASAAGSGRLIFVVVTVV